MLLIEIKNLGREVGLDRKMSSTVRSMLVKVMWARLAEMWRHQGQEKESWALVRQY